MVPTSQKVSLSSSGRNFFHRGGRKTHFFVDGRIHLMIPTSQRVLLSSSGRNFFHRGGTKTHFIVDGRIPLMVQTLQQVSLSRPGRNFFHVFVVSQFPDQKMCELYGKMPLNDLRVLARATVG